MLHIAVAGVPHSTPSPGGTVAGLRHANSLGITAMEMEWVQRVPENEDRMAEILTTAEELSMYLTVHAPYYINLNAAEKAKLEASKKRVLTAMRMAALAGAKSVCVHPAFYLKDNPDIAYDNVRRTLDDIMSVVRKEDLPVNLALETMGKHTQFGTLDEVLRLSAEYGIYPVVDFAHLHARANGALNSAAEWNDMLDQYEDALGKNSLSQMHIHYSGIEYTEKGERRHLPLKDSDANWQELLSVLHKRKVGGSLVCESPTLEDDTLILKEFYESLS